MRSKSKGKNNDEKTRDVKPNQNKNSKKDSDIKNDENEQMDSVSNKNSKENEVNSWNLQKMSEINKKIYF